MTMRPATEDEIKAHFEADDYEVRIDAEGHIEYRQEGGEWLEGRWVQEYRYSPTAGVFHN